MNLCPGDIVKNLTEKEANAEPAQFIDIKTLNQISHGSIQVDRYHCF